MRSDILIAIIAASPALITAVATVVLNNRILEVKLEALQQQFDRVEKKVDSHNSFMERIARLEQKTSDLAS